MAAAHAMQSGCFRRNEHWLLLHRPPITPMPGKDQNRILTGCQEFASNRDRARSNVFRNYECHGPLRCSASPPGPALGPSFAGKEKKERRKSISPSYYPLSPLLKVRRGLPPPRPRDYQSELATPSPAPLQIWRRRPPALMAIRVPSMELHRPAPLVSGGRGKTCLQKKPFLVQAKRLGGLEKASTRGAQESGQPKKRAPLIRGTVSPPLPVPGNIPRPPYVGTKDVPEIAKEIQMHDKESIIHMRAACELAARVLEYAGTLVKPSVTTDEIDKAVHKMIIDAGAYPSPLGYGGFPKSVCTSVNECMCHGIPDSRALQDGDIINIDVTVYLNGYHGDTSKTFLCGEVDEASKRLVKVTEECLLRGISTCKHGTSFKKIGRRISEHAERHGLGVVECFVGHGVGRVFHSEPIIYHQRNNKPGQMVEGQTFTIEPILSMGSTDCDMWDDGWTAVTTDGSLAAQFEHTILITRTGAEILTKC
ncbi:hypothetical protein SEVIR_7G243800v4 [Setaria viridis]